jgi:cytochrome d ubiquinol oxidase subunit I
MNTPRGFRLVDGRVVDPNPWAAMFNPATGPETTHMILAAIMVTGFAAAAVYAVAMLRGRRDSYHRLGLLLPLTVAAAVTPVQIVVGDWAARVVATDQPTKLAAMEGLYHSGAAAPIAIGGYYSGDRLHGRWRFRTDCRCSCTSIRTAWYRAWMWCPPRCARR